MQNADTPSSIHATPRLLEGKHAVITGGSEGIGFGIAQAFVHAGASLILIRCSTWQMPCWPAGPTWMYWSTTPA